ncbi:MAG: T9SS type A sorting domain-containing protein [Flavobacteriales bacterium]
MEVKQMAWIFMILPWYYLAPEGDTFISSYDLNFNLINVFQIGGSGQQNGLYLIPSLISELWVSGNFWNATEPSGYSGISIDNLEYSHGSFLLNFNYCDVPLVSGTISGDSSICENTSNEFLVEVDEPIDAGNFHWTVTAAQSSEFSIAESLNILEFTPPHPDTLSISCRLLNSCGISNSVGPVQAIVRESPSINVIANLPSLVCENSEVVISVEEEEGVIYIPDASIELDVPFTVTGSTNFTISAISSYGCYADTLLEIPLHLSPVSDWSISPSGVVCVGQLVTSEYTPESNLVYSSNFTNGESFTIDEDIVLELIIEDELGCIGYYYEPLHLSPLPNIEMQPQDMQIIEGEPFFFQVLSTESDLEFNWQKETMNVWNPIYNSNFYQGVNTSTLTGAYSNLWNDGDRYRCKITSGTCDTYSDVAVLHVEALNGVQPSLSVREFDLWPNPTMNNLTIAISSMSIGSTLSIYNSIGERIDSIIIQSEQMNYSVQKFPSGIYYVKIDTIPETIKTFCKY